MDQRPRLCRLRVRCASRVIEGILLVTSPLALSAVWRCRHPPSVFVAERTDMPHLARSKSSGGRPRPSPDHYGGRVRGREREQSGEDPSVAGVEAILRAAAPAVQPGPRSARSQALHALWICACVTIDDAPTWLIYDTEDGVSWCRVADGIEPLDLIDARLTAGGHAEPSRALFWLEGKAADPWGDLGSGWGEAAVLEQLLTKIRHR